jgi:peptidoglycan/LPS O-acetylase OafA/YrhL
MTEAPQRGADAAAAAQAPRLLPSLDGWRALSIALVLGSHCGAVAGFPASLQATWRWLFDGDLGVRMFFIISGFLITWLMLREHDRSGAVSLRRFYARRALRILPVYAAFLAVLAALQAFTPFRQSGAEWIGNLTFTTNFVGTTAWTSGHLWSLAVEEQFYLLWPSLVVGLGLATNLRRALRILAVALVVAAIARTIWFFQLAPAPLAPLFTGYSFFNYFDAIAIGCAAAMLYARKEEAVMRWTMRNPRALVAIALLLIAVPYVWTRLLVMAPIAVPFGNTLQGIGMAALLLQSLVAPTLGFYPMLNTAVAKKVGVLSYSLYIWQQLFSTRPEVFGLGDTWWLSFPWWLLPTFAAAFASYYWLERPLLLLRAKLR